MIWCWHNWGEGWIDVPRSWDTYPPKEQYKQCSKCHLLKIRKTRWFDH